MGIIDRLKGMNTGALVALAVGVAIVGLILFVVVAVVLAAVVGTFVLGVGESVESGESVGGGAVSAGASVQPDAEANEVRVVWTANGNADSVLVEWDAPDGDVQPTDTEGDTVDENGAVRLSAVGSSVTLSAAAEGDTAVTVTVTAVNADGESVIDEQTVTI